MQLTALSCVWTVTAGLIPGAVDEQYTRQWIMTSKDWDLIGAGLGIPDGAERFMLRMNDAYEYAKLLMAQAAAGGPVSWVKVDFIWM